MLSRYTPSLPFLDRPMIPGGTPFLDMTKIVILSHAGLEGVDPPTQGVDPPMRRVSISELKAKLSEFIALVQSGEEVLVTDRGRPVARISGLRDEAGRSGRLQRLIRLGRVRQPVDDSRFDRGRVVRPSDPAGRALRALLEERRAGR